MIISYKVSSLFKTLPQIKTKLLASEANPCWGVGCKTLGGFLCVNVSIYRTLTRKKKYEQVTGMYNGL